MNRNKKFLMVVATCTTACLSSCKQTETEKIQAFVPGTYVYSHFNKSAMHFDTLIIKVSDTDNANMFEVNHTWTEVPGIKPFKEYHASDLSVTQFDPLTKSIRVKIGVDTVKVFFRPAFDEALIEGVTYAQKLN